MTDSEVKKLERMRYEAFEARSEAVSTERFFYYSGKIEAIDEIEKMFGVTEEQIMNAQ